MQHLAPIALFVYNRPDHTRRTLKFLQQNFLADESRLFIFSDGAKKSDDEEKVGEVRALIKDVEGFKSVDVVERESNIGLAGSIIDGVSRLSAEYGKVIVFEDDLISSPHTLQYFNQALAKYEHQEKVMHISAYMYPLNTAELPEAFFTRIAMSWGWATWKRAWDHFEPDIDKLISKFDKKRVHEFSIEGTMNFWKQVNEFKAGRNNSWAIRWYASVFHMGGLCLNPSASLINNIGHDASGVHSGLTTIYNVPISNKQVSSFPEDLVEDSKAYMSIRHFLKHRKGNIFKRAMRYMKQRIALAKSR